MEQNFNRLTPSEAERLALLAEEMGEAIQAVGKILRHGYESRHPQGGPTNREALEKELGDVRHSMIRLCDSGDLSKAAIHEAAEQKAERVGAYLHHQGAA
jgi:NTP pyrophosphatase (non-canonical NTP hydrolase)